MLWSADVEPQTREDDRDCPGGGLGSELGAAHVKDTRTVNGARPSFSQAIPASPVPIDRDAICAVRHILPPILSSLFHIRLEQNECYLPPTR